MMSILPISVSSSTSRDVEVRREESTGAPAGSPVFSPELRQVPEDEGRLLGAIKNVGTSSPGPSLENLSSLERSRFAGATGGTPSPKPTAHDLLPQVSPPKHGRYAMRGDVVVRGENGDLALRKDHYVVVEGARILSVGAEAPEDTPVIETDGTIMPGLIDLHDHLRYAYSPRFGQSIFSEDRSTFANRFDWQIHQHFLDFKDHHNHHIPRGDDGAQVAFELYGEMRELVGGTTSVADQVSDAAQTALARNVYGSEDTNGLGQSVSYEVYPVEPGPLNESPPRFEMKESFLQAVENSDVTYVHLAEGKPGDAITRGELEAFLNWAEENPQLAKKVVPIHLVGLEPEDFQRLRDVGVDTVIWSPYSNMVLYGETMDVESALGAGFKVALGTDWYPSGSDSLFDEMRYARSLVESGVVEGVTEDALSDMILKNPADILGAPEVGRLEAGAQADIIVVPKGDSVMDVALGADVDTMQLVMVGGQPYYGRTDLMDQVVQDTHPAPERPHDWSFSFDYRPIRDYVSAALRETGQEILPLEPTGETVPDDQLVEHRVGGSL